MAGEKKTKKNKYSRRDFVVGSGTIIVGGALSAYASTKTSAAATAAAATAAAATAAPEQKNSYSLSTGYLVYDSRRCAGCQSCMLACSLVHEGETSTSLSRIQVSRAVLARYPYDIQIDVCRQCPEPLCVRNCPKGACHVSAANGNVRMIEAEKCIGCQTCLKVCPHSPHRTIWNPAAKKATKCDLCSNAPYFNKKGGPSGKQACVATCPMGALKLVKEMPSQADISGYDVILAPPKAPPGVVPEAKPATAGH
jgi:protein NrfC